MAIITPADLKALSASLRQRQILTLCHLQCKLFALTSCYVQSRNRYLRGYFAQTRTVRRSMWANAEGTLKLRGYRKAMAIYCQQLQDAMKMRNRFIDRRGRYLGDS